MATVDWTQQLEEATKQWTEVQTQLWSSWGEAAQKASSQAQAKAVWQQMIDQWKKCSASDVGDAGGNGAPVVRKCCRKRAT
ncbi:MAG: hypothetical protein R2932_15400 [Caldilineaceae bacterium]